MTVIFISEFMQINDAQNARSVRSRLSVSMHRGHAGRTEEGNGPASAAVTARRVILAPAILIAIPPFLFRTSVSPSR